MKYIVYYILFFGVSFYGSAQVVDSVQLNQSEVVVFKQIETLDSSSCPATKFHDFKAACRNLSSILMWTMHVDTLTLMHVVSILMMY